MKVEVYLIQDTETGDLVDMFLDEWEAIAFTTARDRQSVMIHHDIEIEPVVRSQSPTLDYLTIELTDFESWFELARALEIGHTLKLEPTGKPGDEFRDLLACVLVCRLDALGYKIQPRARDIDLTEVVRRAGVNLAAVLHHVEN
jgi:hypothetical protein